MRGMRILWLLLVPTAPALLAAVLHPQSPPWRLTLPSGRLTLQQAKALNPLWVDARPAAPDRAKGTFVLTEEHWDAGLEPLIAAWTPERAVVVYCGSGCPASEAVAHRLKRELGWDNVHILHLTCESWERIHR